MNRSAFFSGFYKGITRRKKKPNILNTKKPEQTPIHFKMMGLYDATAVKLNQAAWKESEGSYFKWSDAPACQQFDIGITPCTDGH